MPTSNGLGFHARAVDIASTPAPPPTPLASADDVVQRVPAALLTGWNVAMTLFHAALAAVTLSIGRLDLQVSVYRTGLTFSCTDPDDCSKGWTLDPVYLPAGTLYFTWLVASFFLLSAFFHLLNATVLRSYYLQSLANCSTPTRWIEYFFSAPVMIVIISYSLGERNRSVLLAQAILIAITMPFGYWTEREGRPRSADEWTKPLSERIFPWIIGHVPQTIAWVLIFMQFYDLIGSDNRTPAFVHAILWVELVLFFSFGGASFLSQWYPPRYFYLGELAFQVLSLVSKGLLGILLIANVLMLSSFDDIYNEP